MYSCFTLYEFYTVYILRTLGFTLSRFFDVRLEGRESPFEWTRAFLNGMEGSFCVPWGKIIRGNFHGFDPFTHSSFSSLLGIREFSSIYAYVIYFVNYFFSCRDYEALRFDKLECKKKKKECIKPRNIVELAKETY